VAGDEACGVGEGARGVQLGGRARFKRLCAVLQGGAPCARRRSAHLLLRLVDQLCHLRIVLADLLLRALHLFGLEGRYRPALGLRQLQ